MSDFHNSISLWGYFVWGCRYRDVGLLPLVGRVAAGQPLLAEENIEGRVAVSASLSRPHSYCLRVSGDSMVEAGILDGDIIVVDQDRQAREGDVVVALVEDEATVKRYYRSGGMVELRPANARLEPLKVDARKVMVRGGVVGLLRKYNGGA